MATENQEKKLYECDFISWDKDARVRVCNRAGYEGVPCEGNVRKCELPLEKMSLGRRETLVALGISNVPAFTLRDDPAIYGERP